MSQPLFLRSDSHLSQDSQLSCKSHMSFIADDLLCNSSILSDSQNNSLLDFSQILQISDSQRVQPATPQLTKVKSSQDFAEFYSPAKPLSPRRPGEKSPEQLFQRFPPGLIAFNINRGFKFFDPGQLSLERDFGYVGRRRLRRKGFSVKDINRLFLDPMYLVEHLRQYCADSVLILSQQDYTSIMDFIFVSLALMDVEEEQDRILLEKCFICMLLNYGYTWELRLDLVNVVWINFRANSALFRHKEFCQVFLGGIPDVRRVGPVRARKQGKRFSPKLILQTLTLIRSLAVKGRLVVNNFNELKQLHWLLALTTLHRDFTMNKWILTLVTDILVYLTTLFTRTESQIMELALILTALFRPLHFSSGSRNWTTHNIPNWLRINGYNHPNNIIRILRFIPATQENYRLRSIMAFIDFQIIIGAAPVKILYYVNLPEVWNIVSQYSQQWKAMKASDTTSKCFLLAIEAVVSSLNGISVRLLHADPLRRLATVAQAYLDSLPPEEEKEKDPMKLRPALRRMINHWALLILRLESGDDNLVVEEDDLFTRYVAKHVKPKPRPTQSKRGLADLSKLSFDMVMNSCS